MAEVVRFFWRGRNNIFRISVLRIQVKKSQTVPTVGSRTISTAFMPDSVLHGTNQTWSLRILALNILDPRTSYRYLIRVKSNERVPVVGPAIYTAFLPDDV